MYLHVDARVGGKPRYYMSKNKEESLMLVPDVVRKGVVFLGRKHPKEDEVRNACTAFFVCIQRYPLERAFVYLATAKHCIDAMKEAASKGLSDGKVYIRVNSQATVLPPIETDPDDWFFHPTESEKVDVAIYPISSGYDEWDVKFFTLIPDMTYVNPVIIDREGVGPGDEVFIAGLFTRHAGKTRNIPIIRIGSIAAMSEEPVDAAWCRPHPMEAHLIEARSIGGMSGSPVFVNVGKIEPILFNDGKTPSRGQNTFFLLGLIHGHWNWPLPDVDMESDDELNADKDKKINAGIAMVVPATKIFETVQHPRLRLMREQVFDEEMRERSEDAIPD
jgi:hypothetical protein